VLIRVLFSILAPKHGRRLHLRKTAILIFGVLPASYLSVILVHTLISISYQGVLFDNLVIVVWCLAGIVGTVALVFSFFDKVSRLTVVGVLLGIMAVLPVLVGDWNKIHIVLKFLLGAPLVVGSMLVIDNWQILFQPRKQVE